MTKLHIDLLFLLKPVGDRGLDTAMLLNDARQSRHVDLTEPELVRALRDLADKSFVAPFTSVLNKKRWRLTALGASALAEEGL